MQQESSFTAPSSRTLRTRSHEWIDARSLALAEAIAAKVRQNPELLDVARSNLERWKTRSDTWPRCYREWDQILASRPLDDVLQLLTVDSETGRRLRQSSPFTGILSPRERLTIFKEYETQRA